MTGLRIRGAGKAQGSGRAQGFGVALRPYSWKAWPGCSTLRRHGLAGILADLPGLRARPPRPWPTCSPKIARAAGSASWPWWCCPPPWSLNWQREAERYAPDPKVFQPEAGKGGRAEAFAQIPAHDVCLTTYPLLWRDRSSSPPTNTTRRSSTRPRPSSNAASQAAQVVRTSRPSIACAWTGTPGEPLRELWSQFDFLLPGFLGDTKRDFTTRWRTPIEKHGDNVRRDLLARRIAPFHPASAQRRGGHGAAAQKRWWYAQRGAGGTPARPYDRARLDGPAGARRDRAARGFARSQIVILDAPPSCARCAVIRAC